MITRSKSYSYVLPMLSGISSYLKKNLVDVFIGDLDAPEYSNHIFILYKTNSDDWFKRFEIELEQASLYEASYDITNEYVMMVFRVPEFRQEDYNKFLKGKYSEMTTSYKKLIVNFHKLRGKDRIVGVLYRKPWVYELLEEELNEGLPTQAHITIPRSQESSSIYDPEREVFDKRKILNLVD